MKEKNKTMKATELIKKLVEQIDEYGDTDVIVDYDCRRITGVETLGWRKCSDNTLNQKLNIRTTESGDKFLVVDGYEISINTLLKLPKE